MSIRVTSTADSVTVEIDSLSVFAGKKIEPIGKTDFAELALDPDGKPYPFNTDIEQAFNIHEFVDLDGEQGSIYCLADGCGRPAPNKPGGEIHQTRRWLIKWVSAQDAAAELEQHEHKLELEALNAQVRRLKDRDQDMSREIDRFKKNQVEGNQSRRKTAEEFATIRLRLRQALWGEGAPLADEVPVPELARMVDKRVIELNSVADKRLKGITEALESIPEAVALLEGVIDGGLSAQTRQRVLTLLKAAIIDLEAGTP